MATQIKHRRGSQSEIDAFTPAVGEIVMDTSNDELSLGNGALLGGIRIPKKDITTLSFDVLNDAVTDTSLRDGYTLTVAERTLSYGGGGTWDVVLASTVTPNTYNIVQCTGKPTLALVLRIEVDTVYAEQFGAIADWNGSLGTDNGPAINAAMQFVRDNRDKYSTVRLGVGRFAIEEPIKVLQSVSFQGAGISGGTYGGTEFVCNFSTTTINNPPTDNWDGEEFSPVLDHTPMIYNTELITQQFLGGYRVNGNGKNVYGVHIHEFFYTIWKPISIISCLESPLTLAVGQFNYMELLVCNSNEGSVRMIRQDTLTINGLDTEGNNVSGSMLDVIQSVSTKDGVLINCWHYEETASAKPDTLAKFSGRYNYCNKMSFGMAGANPNRYIELLGVESYTFDGETFNTIAAIGNKFEQFTATITNASFQLNSGAVGNYIQTSSTASVVDNSASTTNQIDGMTGAQRLPRSTTVLNSSGNNHLSFPDDNTVNFYSNANRNLRASGATWIMENLAGRIEINGSTDVFLDAGSGVVDVDAGGGNAGRFDGDSTAGNTRLLVFDVDNNTLERVTVGAADSGGAGFKVLRIPN